MKLFIEITGAVIFGEWIYSWLIAMQSVVIGRIIRRRMTDRLMQKHLEQMPVGRAN